MSYEQWFTRLDKLCIREIGLSVEDLADQPFRDMFDDEMTPAEAWGEIKENENIGS